MKGSAYTIVYAAVLGTTCALVLTFAASFTAPYKQANAEAEEVKNILLVLNVSIPDKASSAEMVKIYKENVREQKRGGITTYIYTPSANNEGSIAMRFAPEITKIQGITFYEQEETPGLGGEIVKPSFRDKFVGLLIRDEAGKPGIIIKNGGEAAANKVDGISGATMTCDKVQEMLNEAIRSIVEEKQ